MNIPFRKMAMCVLAPLAGALFYGATINGAGEITPDRLNNARKEPHNWLVYGGSYAAQRYSALDQIKTSNVNQLKVSWAFQTGVIDAGLQSTPLVADGVMYVTSNNNHVFALDATTGRVLWKYFYEPKKPAGAAAGPAAVSVARGLALGHGHVYFGTESDNFLVALDIATGKEVWRTNVEDKEEFGCSMRNPPLVVKDMVVVGERLGDSGHRGHLVAFDGKTGKQRWWFNVIPGPGEKGHESWGGSEDWKLGGGAPWTTGSYDPELDLIYWGTSNPSSDFYGGNRKGDNLYTNSIVALDASTGMLRWHFQTVPHDVWDFDGVYECILVDMMVAGRPRKLLIQVGKSGYIYVLDRTNGEYVNGWKYAENVNWTSGLDSRGIPLNRKEPELGKDTLICPNFFGARSWNEATFSPKTGLLYNTAIEWCGEIRAREQKTVQARGNVGGTIRLLPPPSGKVGSHLDAFDPLTGRRVWRYEPKYPLLAGLTSTAGDLVFTGDPEGNFFALDAKTGKELWSFQTGSGHRGGSISYGVNGKQYVATSSGWGSTLAGRLGEFFPELISAPGGSSVFAFSLPDTPSSARGR
jgi:alcohol dehydrogenase (cytochrome c)